MNHLKWLAILAIALMASCGRENKGQADAAGSAAPAAGTEAAQAGHVTGRKSVKTPLFEGYMPAFPYNLRTDEIAESDSGKNVRRVTLEYIGHDLDEVDATVADELEEIGYRRGQARQDGEVLRVAYAKRDAPRVSVTLYPAGSLKTRVADAGGFVRFSWEVGAGEDTGE